MERPNLRGRAISFEHVLLLGCAVIGLAFHSLFESGYPELAPFAVVVCASLVASALLLRLGAADAMPWLPIAILLAFPIALVLAIFLNFSLAEGGHDRLREIMGLAVFGLPVFAGALAAFALPARIGRTSPSVYALTLLAVGCLAFFPPALGNFWRPLPEARASSIDETRGLYGDVGIGAAPADVVREHGEAAELGENDSHAPTGLDENDVAHGPNFIPAGPRSLAYPDAIFYLRNDAVVGFEVIGSGARTLRNIEIGDSLDDAREAYPELQCDEGSTGTDSPDSFPYCAGKMATRVHVWFGGDPITSIVVFNQGLG
jgi:hypothetical protein